MESESHHELPGTYVIGSHRPRQRRPRPRVAGTGIAVFVILLIGAGVSAYIVARDRLHLPGASQDPGVPACEAIAAAARSGGQLDQTTVTAQLLASGSAHLRQAGQAAQRLAAQPVDPGQFDAMIDDALMYAGSIGAGCTEVGVNLPPEAFRS